MVQSHERPERMVEINGVRKYRVNVQEVVREENVVYTYDEVEFNVDTPIEISDAKVERLEAKLVEAEVKKVKQLALDSITVEVDGMVFDGRDKDQARMMAAIQASAILGVDKADWKLADDTIREITVDTLKLALAASTQEVGKIVKGEQMAAGKITLQANDGKTLSLVAPEGMVANTTEVVVTSVTSNKVYLNVIADTSIELVVVGSDGIQRKTTLSLTQVKVDL